MPNLNLHAFFSITRHSRVHALQIKVTLCSNSIAETFQKYWIFFYFGLFFFRQTIAVTKMVMNIHECSQICPMLLIVCNSGFCSSG